jgi:hypothetical protein
MEVPVELSPKKNRKIRGGFPANFVMTGGSSNPNQGVLIVPPPSPLRDDSDDGDEVDSDDDFMQEYEETVAMEQEDRLSRMKHDQDELEALWDEEDRKQTEKLALRVTINLVYPFGILFTNPADSCHQLQVAKGGVEEGGHAAMEGQLMEGMILIKLERDELCAEKVFDMEDMLQAALHGEAYKMLWRHPRQYEELEVVEDFKRARLARKRKIEDEEEGGVEQKPPGERGSGGDLGGDMSSNTNTNTNDDDLPALRLAATDKLASSADCRVVGDGDCEKKVWLLATKDQCRDKLQAVFLQLRIKGKKISTGRCLELPSGVIVAVLGYTVEEDGKEVAAHLDCYDPHAKKGTQYKEEMVSADHLYSLVYNIEGELKEFKSFPCFTDKKQFSQKMKRYTYEPRAGDRKRVPPAYLILETRDDPKQAPRGSQSSSSSSSSSPSSSSSSSAAKLPDAADPEKKGSGTGKDSATSKKGTKGTKNTKGTKGTKGTTKKDTAKTQKKNEGGNEDLISLLGTEEEGDSAPKKTHREKGALFGRATSKPPVDEYELKMNELNYQREFNSIQHEQALRVQDLEERRLSVEERRINGNHTKMLDVSQLVSTTALQSMSQGMQMSLMQHRNFLPSPPFAQPAVHLTNNAISVEQQTTTSRLESPMLPAGSSIAIGCDPPRSNLKLTAAVERLKYFLQSYLRMTPTETDKLPGDEAIKMATKVCVFAYYHAYYNNVIHFLSHLIITHHLVLLVICTYVQCLTDHDGVLASKLQTTGMGLKERVNHLVDAIEDGDDEDLE